MTPNARWPVRLHECHRTRSGDASRIGVASVLVDTSFTIEARRVHRRARSERRRQDHADAGHPRIGAAERGSDCACSAAAAARRSGKSATCRRCARCCRTCGCAASISSPVPCTASAGVCRRSRRADRAMIEKTLAAVGAGDLGRAPAFGNVGRRTPAASAGAGAARRAAASAARRTADQPRLSLSGSGDRSGSPALPASATSRCCSAPTSSIS